MWMRNGSSPVNAASPSSTSSAKANDLSSMAMTAGMAAASWAASGMGMPTAATLPPDYNR